MIHIQTARLAQLFVAGSVNVSRTLIREPGKLWLHQSFSLKSTIIPVALICRLRGASNYAWRYETKKTGNIIFSHNNQGEHTGKLNYYAHITAKVNIVCMYT